MEKRWYEIGFLLAVCVLAVCAFACDGPVEEPEPEPVCADGAGDRTEGCDEFSRLIATIRKNGAAQNDGNWHPLETGDTLAADNSGEAELNFSDCWDGRLYLFDNSEGHIRVRDCRKADYNAVNLWCVPDGTVFSDECLGEFSASTESLLLTKLGTSFSITALPEVRETSLVVVLKGRVRVEPVLSYDPTVLGQALEVFGGEFYFTMPDDALSDIAGFQPRVAHPVADLGPVARALGIVDWMIKVRDRAEEGGVLPDNWPPELSQEGGVEVPPIEEPGGDGYVVTSGGGALNDTRTQEAIYRAVDWAEAGLAGSPSGRVVAFVGDEPVDVVGEKVYDPEKSKALMEETGYTGDQGVTILYPAGDKGLEDAAFLVAKDLEAMGIEVGVSSVSAPDLEAKRMTSIAAGVPVIVLSR